MHAPTWRQNCGRVALCFTPRLRHPHTILCRATKTIRYLGREYNAQYSGTLSNEMVMVTIQTSYPPSASALKSGESDLLVESTHSCTVGVCWKRYSFVALCTHALLELLKRRTATKECCAAHTDVVLQLHFVHKRQFELSYLL